MAVAHESGQPQAFKFPMSETERPKSALTRGVQIREFKDLQVNPDPIVIEETELLLAEYLSPRRLRDITGVDDLASVQSLEIKVDTTDTSLGNFGALLPNLRHLRLSNSCIASIRDLGSGFDQLRVLWMSRCCLEEIDGVATMYNLKELYLSYNEINDLSPCSMLDSLQILDLEGNNVDDVCQIEFLAMCSSLRNLTLEGNPICLSPRPDVVEQPGYDYRAAICKSLPQLTTLDDEPASQTSTSRKGTSVFDADWALINELIAEGDILTSEDSPSPAPLRPGSGTTFRPITDRRPGSALRPTSSRKLACRRDDEFRPLTSRSVPCGIMGTGVRLSSGFRPNTSQRPGTTSLTSPLRTPDAADDDASELTLGSVVCGNPSKALRARRKKITTPPTVKHQQLLSEYRRSSITSSSSSPPRPSTADLDPKEDKQLVDLFSEVENWKKLNLKSRLERQEIEEAPQILLIDDNPYVSDSESESESDLLPHDDVALGFNDVVRDEFANAEDRFRMEMKNTSRMMLRELEDESDDVTVGATSKEKSKVGAARFRVRKYRAAGPSSSGSPQTFSVGDSTSPRPPNAVHSPSSGPGYLDESDSSSDEPTVRAPRLLPTRMPKLNLSELQSSSGEDKS